MKRVFWVYIVSLIIYIISSHLLFSLARGSVCECLMVIYRATTFPCITSIIIDY